MKQIQFVLVFACLIASCASPTKVEAPEQGSSKTSNQISYTLEYTACNGTPCLKMSVSFQGNESGGGFLRLPSTTAGQKELWKAVHNLKATDPNVSIKDTTEPEEKEIRYPKNTKLNFTYEIIQDFTGAIRTDDQYYRAIIQKNYFFTLAEQILVYPSMDDSKKISLNINWINPPENFASSFGSQEAEQEFVGSFRTFKHGIFLGGDFRISKFEHQKFPVYVALHGNFGFSDAQMIRVAQKIIKAERDFWVDRRFPFFMITGIEVQQPGIGGTGRTNSFALFMKPGAKADWNLSYVLAHELFHTWNGRKIEREQPEELQYWFSEGFTDYYARLLSFRAGLITFKEYVDDFNSAATRYFTSSVRNEPVERVLKDFWNNSEVEKLPYQQGNLLAARWNMKIKARFGKEKSLDDFMRDLFVAAKSEHAIVSANTVDKLIKKYLPDGILDDHQKYIAKGETIPFLDGMLGPCVKVVTKPTAPFYLGLDRIKTKSNFVITGIDPDGPAYKAGIREGMKLVGWDVNINNHKVDLTISDGKASKAYSYKADGKITDVPQFEIDQKKYKKSRSKCEKYLKQ